MKIVVVCDVLGKENNGTTIAAMNLIRYLKSKGHDVRVICPDADKAGLPGFFIVPVFNVGPFNNYVKKNGVTLAKVDKDIIEQAMDGADVIHIMIPFILGRYAIRYAKLHNIPVSCGFHCQAENITNHIFLMNSGWVNTLTYKIMYKRFYRYADVIHYPTEFIRNVFEEIVGPTNGQVISNGVNKAFSRKDVNKPDEYKDKFVILFTGRYGREKSHKVLIEAVSRLDKIYDIQLIFAGCGPQEENLKRLARQKLKNQPVMKFFSREEMTDVINYSDLYVHPAEIEIESIACLEAITCGLVPVIANSPRSAARYFAIDERHLFDTGDPADLAKKIAYWIDNPDEKAAESNRYLGYSRQFDQDVCMERMEEMLRSLIS